MNDWEKNYVTSLEAFDRINDAFESLIDLFSRIYDLLYGELYILEKEGARNTIYFDECLRKLKIYYKKIDRVRTIIGTVNYDDFSPLIEAASYDHDTTPGKREIIMERIESMFNSGSDFYREYYGDDDEDVIYYEGPDERFDDHILNFHIDFIIHTASLTDRYPRLLKHRYELSMLYPEIEKELLYAGYNPENILNTSDVDRAHLMKIDLLDYENEKCEACFECIISTINSLISLTEKATFDIDKVRNMLDFIRFIAKKLLTEDLERVIEINERKMGSDNTGALYQDVSVFEVMMQILERELERRKFAELQELIATSDESNNNESNKTSTLVSGYKMGLLFDLVKQVIHTSHIMIELYGLEIVEKNNTPEFLLLIDRLRLSVEKEKELAGKIYFNDFERDMALELVEQNLILFSEINPSNTLEDLDCLCKNGLVIEYDDFIKSRIADLLPNLYSESNSFYKTPEIPEQIISSHHIETLKALEEIIPTSPERVPLIVAKYEIILASVRIMDAFIEYRGRISDIKLLDDYLAASLLDIEFDEYELDRSECLYLTILEYFENLGYLGQVLTPLEKARKKISALFVSLAIDKLLSEHIRYLWDEEYLEYSMDEPVKKLEKKFYETW